MVVEVRHSTASSHFKERKISEPGEDVLKRQATFLSCVFLSNRAFYILSKGIFLNKVGRS